MMGHRTRLVDATEYDAFASQRHVYHWNAGTIKYIKRKHNKRIRRQSKARLRGNTGTAG